MSVKIFFSLLVMVLFLTSCGDKTQKLYIANWSVYMPTEVLKNFEKKYKVKIVYDEYTSNEELFAKLKAGAKGYDIVFPSGDYVSIMAKEGMLAKLDHNKIPKLSNLDPAILSKIKFDVGNVYSVPYVMGAAGIAVNTAKVKNFPKDFTIFDREDLKGKMTLLDDMREVMGAALKEKGHSVNSGDMTELQQAKKVVLNWKKNIQKFDAESFGKSYAAGEFVVVHGYAENVFKALEGNEALIKSTEFFIPKKGTSMYVDNMVMLKDAKNTDLAYQFINYIHEPEVYAMIANFFALPSANVPARKYVTVKPHYELSDLENCEFKEDLGNHLEIFNKIWQEIRVEN